MQHSSPDGATRLAAQNHNRADAVSRRCLLAGALGLAAFAGGARAQEAGTTDFWGARPSDLPQDFIFGYGSLINEPSRTSTSGRQVAAVPARLSAGFGHVRGFVARAGARWGAGFTALGLRPPGDGEAPATINGVVFPATAPEMAAFDRRESGYVRVEVLPAFIEPAGWQGLPAAGRIWVYIPATRDGAAFRVPDAAFPVVQSYVDVVLEGCLAEGTDFTRELIATTFDWSEFWLDDRPVPRRPWALTPQAGAIDRLLAATAPAAARFRDRAFPEVYAARHLLPQPVPEGAR